MTSPRFIGKSKIALLLAWLTMLAASFAEPEAKRSELPRIPPTEPADALATFKLVPGYSLELVASEPLVVDPIAMAFDEKRRLFVVEMRGYSERRDEKLGRIRLLTDDDGDGKFDHSTIYAEGLSWPTAVIAWKGGVFVAATPDIFYLKDEDGDGVSDRKEAIFTGFGAGTNRLNVQALVNNFKWGPDGRIHGATAGNGGRVIRVGDNEKESTNLRGVDFSFDPETLDFRSENGGGQYGLCFDRFGRKFVCSNSNHIQQVMYPRRYAGAPLPPPRVGIARDGPAAEVYRMSPDEPWRIVRTRWRVAGEVKGPVEGGGRVSGYFTAATGIEVHRGDAFICDAGSNLLHRKSLVRTEDSVEMIAVRPEAEKNVEFLASTDNWFRPVQSISGPDGALYIADMYREVIEHPWSLPGSIKKHLDLNSGHDRGRIYRIVPENFVQPVGINLGELSTGQLVSRLSARDGEIAVRLLRERGDIETVALLKIFLASDPPSVARLRALRLIHLLGGLDAPTLAHALSNLDVRVVCHALILSEDIETFSDPLREKLISLGKHRSVDVRYQLALTLGLRDGDWRIPVLAEVMSFSNDGWVDAAAMKALGGSAGKVITTIAGADRPPGIDLLKALATVIAKNGDASELAGLRKFADESSTQRFQILNPLAWSSVEEDNAWIQERSKDALAVATDGAQSPAERAAAAQFFCNTGHDSAELVALFESTKISSILDAIVEVDTRGGDAKWGERIVARWKDFSPGGRVYAIEALLVDERLPVLLDAIDAGKIPAHMVDSSSVDRLRKAGDPELRALAHRVFDGVVGDRDRALKEFWPSLRLKGDAGKGHATYTARCMICHRSEDEGFAHGPDVASFRTAGKELILTNLIDPNREIPPQYSNYEIRMKDGNTIVGRISRQDKDQVWVSFPAGLSRSLAREEIELISPTPHSPMPQGLEGGLTLQQMADLLEFLAVAPDSN